MGSSIGASIASVVAQPSSGGASVTSAGIDTTGANFIMVAGCGYDTYLTAGTLTDQVTIGGVNRSNTWTQVLGPSSANNGDGAVAIWVCFNPAYVGPGHTFSFGATTYATMLVDARAGVNSGTVTANQLQETVSGTSLSWSLTPPDDGSLLYLVVGDGNGTESLSGGGFSGWEIGGLGVTNVAYGGRLASLVQGAAATSTPSITGGGAPVNGYLFSFKPASYSGGASYTLTADYGPFSESGEAASLSWGTGLSAANGDFALTGESSSFQLSAAVTAAVGQFVLIGEPANLGANAAFDAGLPLTRRELEEILKRENKRKAEIEAAWAQRKAEREGLRTELRNALQGNAVASVVEPAIEHGDSEDEDIEVLLLHA